MSNAPICEQCNIQMVERTRRSDGKMFYGCPNFPKCRETERDDDSMEYDITFDNGEFYK
jgi:ssDNA-binding Zn-finger/Zn-ribbon topoisomerase 1